MPASPLTSTSRRAARRPPRRRSPSRRDNARARPDEGHEPDSAPAHVPPESIERNCVPRPGGRRRRSWRHRGTAPSTDPEEHPMTVTFDPVRYKDTTRAQWEEPPPPGTRWGPTLEDWLGEATDADARRRRDHHRQHRARRRRRGRRAVAGRRRRVGPTGQVLATDISPAILDYAASGRGRAGLTNVAHPGARRRASSTSSRPAFDAVISRLGLIYFPDQPGALAGQYRALRPGGRIAAIVYSTAGPQRLLLRPGVDHPAARPAAAARTRQPGPFSLGAPACSTDAFRDGRVPGRRLPGRAGPAADAARAADCVRFERESFGALHQMLAGLAPERAGRGLAGDRHRAGTVRGRRGLRGPVRADRRLGNQMTSDGGRADGRWWPGAGSNRRPTAFQAVARTN